MNNAKPGLPTTIVIGMVLPVISDLGDGWFLVAHPNGAAIANETYLSVLWAESTETAFTTLAWDEDQEEESPISESVRAKAVEEFERFAWPLVRGQFYMEAKDKVPV